MYQSQELLKVNYKCSTNFKQIAFFDFVSAFSGAGVYHTRKNLALRNGRQALKVPNYCKL